MPTTFNKLTTLGVLRLAAPGYHGDGGGLVLQITPNGAKSWLFRYRCVGKIREMGLGAFHTVDLAKAREAARECRQMLQQGRDPLEERRHSAVQRDLARARQITFDQCAEAYIDAYRSGWKNPKHAEQWINTLATYASTLIGNLPVAMVDTDLIVKVLREPLETYPALWRLGKISVPARDLRIPRG